MNSLDALWQVMFIGSVSAAALVVTTGFRISQFLHTGRPEDEASITERETQITKSTIFVSSIFVFYGILGMPYSLSFFTDYCDWLLKFSYVMFFVTLAAFFVVLLKSGIIFPGNFPRLSHDRPDNEIFYEEFIHPPSVDVVILTVLPEEYESIRSRLSELGLPSDMGSLPNLYAWKFGKVFSENYSASYKVAVGMIVQAGTTEGALAAREAVQLWRPRYILVCGIAGGLPDPEAEGPRPRLGDVVIADVIYGYEYGTMDKKFKPRANWTYRTDETLLRGATAYAQSESWKDFIKADPPLKCVPEVIIGSIASGDKLVEDPSNEFFSQVLEMWPKVRAVEMEGAGVANAVEQALSLGIPVGFMMIRGISDLPHAEGEGKGTQEREAWKAYASDVAAAFVVGWISDGLPLRPSS